MPFEIFDLRPVVAALDRGALRLAGLPEAPGTAQQVRARGISGLVIIEVGRKLRSIEERETDLRILGVRPRDGKIQLDHRVVFDGGKAAIELDDLFPVGPREILRTCAVVAVPTLSNGCPAMYRPRSGTSLVNSKYAPVINVNVPGHVRVPGWLRVSL